MTLFQRTQPFYFLTFNTWNRQRLLADERIHNAFVSFCTRAHETYHVAVGRYVIMPDHIHLFVYFPEEGIPFVRWVQSLKSTLGKCLLASGHDKPHWQDGFFDHVLRSAESYSQKWDYVRRNPERAGLCDNADDWTWQGEIVKVEF